ncbi:ubiquitin-specific protease UBP14 [Sporobolomyces koalae]|uniref:ubiquitin-specific protease UBP14 n=1 Tax=Sporobolomyces koalae TaxID=500713 RepID=UPI00316F3B05
MTAHVPDEVLAQLSPPRASQLVHREECTQCFDTVWQSPEFGLDVCLHCFNGACSAGSTNQHSNLHADKTGHSVVVNIVKRKKQSERRKRDSQEPPIKKLAIREDPSEEETYETTTTVKMWQGGAWVPVETNFLLDEVVQGVLSSMSSAQKSEVQAWEEEIVPCSHTRELVQPSPRKLEPSGLAHCSKCELSSNLWLCLVCGALGCGRQQFGGGGGNGHGLEHTQETGHAVAVKLGTIEPDGSADVYCYACDDARIDPHLAQHLSTFGIEVAGQKKTEKSMTELQVEQNMNFDFAMTGADGKELEPVFGPGLTGLKNLGNSCYMASSLQSLFSLPVFQDRYLTSFLTHVPTCTNPNPATCFECQMSKIADGLLSGRYSIPSSSNSTADDSSAAPTPVRFQDGIKPSMFKALVGKDHSEFSTMKQQDAGEFLNHLLEYIRRSSKKENSQDVTVETFGYSMEERLECTKCRGVRYRQQDQEGLSIPVPIRKLAVDMVVEEKESSEGDGDAKQKKEEYERVELKECLDNLTTPQEIDYTCSACNDKTTALKSTRFSTFPQVLIVNAARFQLDNWVPRKVDVPLTFDPKCVDLSQYLGQGLQPGETELLEDESSTAPAQTHEFDEGAMNQLMGMGFPEIRAQRALLKTGNEGAEVAMNWLFEHMDDTDLDDPLPSPTAATSSSGNEPNDEQISMIVDMGFTKAQGRKALLETGGDPNRAVEWLFSHPDDDGSIEPLQSGPIDAGIEKNRGDSSLPARYRLKSFISHKGPSVHSGHYVAHVWTGQADVEGQSEPGSWVLFNDEKVVRANQGEQSADKWRELAYVYLFERI